MRLEIESDQAAQGFTHEDLIRLVGPDYQDLVLRHLHNLGVLRDGEMLEFVIPPGRHKDSDALYLFEGIIGNDWIFVHVLPPYSTTSTHQHWHQNIEFIEDYHILRGKLSLHLGGGGELHELNEKNKFLRVFPKTLHKSTTDEIPALTIIRMPNAAPIPRSQLHSK